MSSYAIHIGDCIKSLQEMPSQSVHTVVTSPPYYGLRDYGTEGQIGLEETPELFIQRLVEVFRAVRRVLRDDGTVWINIGDSYAQFRDPGVKAKDLLGIPWMLAFALRADGWYLRQDIIWHKTNAMPESVKDRCTKAHEYLFLLSKYPHYYFDHAAFKEPVQSNKGNANGFRGGAYVNNATFNNAAGGKRTTSGNARSRRDSFKRDNSKRAQVIPGQNYGTHRPDREESAWDTGMRNRRSVWSVATRAFRGAHLATFPPELIEPCILAGCPVGGTVLDMFAGTGTTAGVAIANGRNAVLCELNAQYAGMIPERVESIVSKMGVL